jgi:acetylornithine deacetylase
MDQREIAALLAELVACDSTNPELAPGGAGEAAHAALVAKWMERIGFQVEVTDAAPGRPNVLATLPGTGNGRNLLICGHGDVVAAAPEAFQPRIDGDRMRGRGTIDMKGGLVAGMAAAAGIAAGDPLAGDLILAVVADEEFRSAGAEALAADLEADGAILPEQTALDLVTEHGGFAWFEITAQGVEAAGDDPEGGVDAIAHLGRTLDGLLALDRELAERPAAPYGRPCLHAGTLSGGSQLSAYPAEARVGIERCTVPGETWQQARRELEALIEGVAPDDPRATLALNTLLGRDPIRLDPDEPVVEVLAESAASILGRAPTLRGDMGWMDSGVLTPAGIPCVAFGPIGGGEHTPDEWVDLPSIATCAAVLEEAARRFCS